MKLLSIVLALVVSAAAQSPWSSVDKALGRPGTLADGVYKVTFPRTDLHVRMGSTVVEPGAALGSWMGFRQDGSSAVVDGDLVLLPGEISAVAGALQDGGLEVTAIHNHLAGEQPEVMYLHFFGRGDAEKLATALRSALAKTATPIAKPASPAKITADLKQAAIEAALGKPGKMNGKVFSFSFPRSHAISMHNAELKPSMGMATSINFQPAAKGAAATGDFVLAANEVNPVINALTKGGISVTALHNHLLDDDPHMYFLHFWGEGSSEALAKTLKQALDQAAK